MIREKKETGIPWIGKIPANWEIGKIKKYYKMTTGFTPDTKNGNYYTDDPDKGTDWITISDLTDNKYIPSRVKQKISNEYIEHFNPAKVLKGSLLYSFKLSVGQVAFADRDIYTNEAIASFIDNDNVNLNYLYYSSILIKYNANENIYGAKLLNQDLIKNSITIFPPLSEQGHIANYLDKKCEKLNKLIEGNKKIINLLEDYKVAIITDKTLNGLKKNCEYKNSKVVWFKKVPVNWEIRKIRNILKERNEKNNPIISEDRLSLSIDKGVTTYAEKTTNLDRYKEDFTKYKLAYPGDLVLNCMNMIVGAVGVSDYFGCVSPIYYTLYDEEENHITSKYCEYLFRTKPIRKYLFSLGRGIMSIDRGNDRINTCRLKISRDDLKNIEFPYPSLNEQKDIVEYLNLITNKIDDMIKYRYEIIDKIKEYRSTLIYNVVTGKKEV